MHHIYGLTPFLFNHVHLINGKGAQNAAMPTNDFCIIFQIRYIRSFMNFNTKNYSQFSKVIDKYTRHTKTFGRKIKFQLQ